MGLSSLSRGASSPDNVDVEGETVALKEITVVPSNPTTSGSDLSPIFSPPARSGSAYDSLPLKYLRKEIRVLDLHGYVGQPLDAPLSGAMRVVDLANDTPSYAALSYQWGQFANPPDTIACNDGCHVPITPSCLAALRHLRRLLGPVTIWVDAICIDQHVDSEKRHQIPMMADVYARAQVVYAWLGEGNQSSDKAMDFLARGALPFRRLITDYIHLPTGESIPTGRALSFRLALHCLLHVRRRSHGLDHWLQRPWVRRLWTLQEAVLAHQLRLVCGEKMVDWRCVGYSLDVLDSRCAWQLYRIPVGVLEAWRRLAETRKFYQRTIQSEKEYQAHRAAVQKGLTWYGYIWRLLWWIPVVILPLIVGLVGSVAGVYSAIWFGIWGTLTVAAMAFSIGTGLRQTGFKRQDEKHIPRLAPRSPAVSVILELKERESSFPKDKYYALYSFIRRERQPQTPDRPLPDYSKIRLHIVYRVLFRDLLEYTGSLEVLLFTPSSFVSHGSPSWVVDWRVAPLCWVRSVPDTTRKRARDRFNPHINTSYHIRDLTGVDGFYSSATPGSKSLWRFSRGTQLIVHGHLISQVAWSSGPIQFAPESTRSARLAQMRALLLEAATSSGGHELKSLVDSLVRLLNRPRVEVPLSMELNSSLATFLVKHSSSSPSSAGETNMMQSWLDRIFWLIIPAFDKMSEERIGLTRCSSSIMTGAGYAPDTTEPGDIVALVSGVSLPMILRPREGHEGHYTVVGPAHFSAATEGKVWKHLNHGDMREFVLV